MGDQGSSATGDTVPGGSGNSDSGVHVDPDGLIHPIAIVAQAASTYQTAIGSLIGLDLTGLFNFFSDAPEMGDAAVQSAWDAFQSAWLSEADAATKALNELATHVPKSVHALQHADNQGGKSVGGEGGSSSGTGPASGPPSSAPPSGTNSGTKGTTPSGGVAHGRVHAE
ncbi:hypothetical protein [Nocardia macrotermitis]|uniref:Uncharacterized protein n=1 Tax=Nocardia macrotermitis TaxID=2585198 RepID=A0A7K0D3L1_9NOCA|nr:hypothetical protein [Nocardia macrotermitis]MQY19514.1 hypothetical protein [Nocardia macrotermitis]